MTSEITTQANPSLNDSLNQFAFSNRQATKPGQTAESQVQANIANKTDSQTVSRVDEKIAKQLNAVEQLQEEVNKEFSMEELQEVLDQINSAFYLQNRAVKFEIHDKTEDLVVQVLNTKTDEVIRQYPSEEILNRRKRLIEGDTNFFSTQVY